MCFRNGKKSKSEANLAEIIGVDLFKSNRKLTNVMQYVDVPEELNKPLTSTSDFVYIPQVNLLYWAFLCGLCSLTLVQLFVVNFMLPAYNPSNPLWGSSVNDGESYSVVIYVKVGPEVVKAIREDSYPAATLLKVIFLVSVIVRDSNDLTCRIFSKWILNHPMIMLFGAA